MTLRERMIGVIEDFGIGPYTFDIEREDKDTVPDLADAILTLPELRAIAAGELFIPRDIVDAIDRIWEIKGVIGDDQRVADWLQSVRRRDAGRGEAGMTLRERIAQAVYESGQAYEGQSETYPPWGDIQPDEYLFYADAILAVIAAGNLLWIECETCGGTCYAPNLRDDCPVCGGVGFVTVGEEP